jgi:hypothetical protein
MAAQERDQQSNQSGSDQWLLSCQRFASFFLSRYFVLQGRGEKKFSPGTGSLQKVIRGTTPSVPSCPEIRIASQDFSFFF